MTGDRHGSGVGLLQRRIRVALGQEAGDLLLRCGQVVNVFTGRVETANVVVADGWIAGVGPFDWTADAAIDLDGQAVLPGLVDSHMHLESTLLAPAELGDDWALVTDDVLLDDMRQHGHLDGLLRRLVAGGVAPAQAVRHASFVPARHYGLTDRGAVAPGYRADLVVTDDLRHFRPALVFKDGRLVARAGNCVADLAAPPLPTDNTVHIAALDESAFNLPLRETSCPVIRIIPGQLVTRAETRNVHCVGGRWAWRPEQDVLLLASIERHRATGQVGLGLVSGFNLRKPGALGSSVAHDSHNLIVAGTNARDLLVCARALAESGGGFVAVADGAILAHLPLPFAGLLSREPADVVCRQLREVRQAAWSLGCELACPFGALSFLALPVIPELRVTDRGLWDVVGQRVVPLS